MRKNIVLLIFTFIIGSVFALGEAVPVSAQGSDIDEFTLEEITVTAQKREQDLQKVSSDVSVIQGYELTEMGIDDLDDALKHMSSAVVQPVGEEMTVVIRGMDNDAMPGDSFSQVAVTVDGSFSNNWGIGTTGLYDMQRIEVLSGPQGTLYSRNSSGGVVNMISNDPITEEFDGSGSVEVGNYNLVKTEGMINVPITDDWAARAAFVSTKRDGYASTGLHDADDRSMRLKLGYTPSDNMSAVMTYEYTHIGGKSQGDGFKAFEDEDDVDNPWTGASDGDLFNSDTRTDRFYMNLNWGTSIGELTFLPSYSDTSRYNIQATKLWSDGTAGAMNMSPTAEVVKKDREWFISPQNEMSFELRMASDEDSFMDWLIGLYYYEREWADKTYTKDIYGEWNGEIIYSPSEEVTAGFDKVVSNPSKSAFGNFTYPITDTFRATVGGRYTADEEDISGVDRMTGAPTFNHYESSHFDYKLNLEYDLAENAMVWVDHSTGYKHVMQNRASQELDSYQMGVKSRFLNNKMQLNATGFYYDYTNFDIGRVESKWLEVEGEQIEYGGSGIGDAILYGLDASIDFVVTRKDNINFSLSYLSAEVDEVIITYTYNGEESALFPPETVDAGKPLNNAPEFSIVGSYNHKFDLANGGVITPRIDARYTSEYFLEFYPEEGNVPEGMDVEKVNTEPAKVMGDFSVSYTDASGKWTFNAYVKNITDHAEKNGFMRGDLRLGPPRTYGGVLSLSF